MDGNWRKSSFSFSNGNCAEVASWRVSTRSMSNGHCVQVGQGAAVVGVRDTKDDGRGPVLVFSAGAWETFTGRLKRA
jgi:hypothetical protein